MNTAPEKLTNHQMLNKIEEVMNAFEHRQDWSDADRKVFLNLHEAWKALAEAVAL